MAQYLTGRTRNLEFIGSISGIVRAWFDPSIVPAPGAMFLNDAYFQLFGGGDDRTSPPWSVEGSAWIDPGLIGTIWEVRWIVNCQIGNSYASGTWSYTFNVGPGGTIWEKDITGNFYVSVPVQEYLDVTFGGHPGYGGIAGTLDNPPESTVKYIERSILNGTAFITINSGGASATAQHIIDNNQQALLPENYTVTHQQMYVTAVGQQPLIGNPPGSATTLTIRTLAAGMGTLITPYQVSGGSVLVHTNPPTVHCDAPGSGQVLRAELNNFKITANKHCDFGLDIWAMENPFPGPVTCKFIKLKGGTATIQTVGTTGHYGELLTQRKFSGSAILNWVGQPGTSVDEWTPIKLWVDADWLSNTGEKATDWRIMMRGLNWPSFQLNHIGTLTIDAGTSLSPPGGTWANQQNTTLSVYNNDEIQAVVGAGGGSFYRNWSGSINFHNYRYLRLLLRSDQNNQPLTIAIGTKEWSTTIGTAQQVVDFDLCAPHNGTVNEDPTDSRWERPTMDGPLFGVGFLGSIVFKNLAGGRTYWIDDLQLVRKTFAELTVLPSHEWWISQPDGSLRKRLLLGNTDGKQSLEEADAIRTPPAFAVQDRSIVNLIADIGGNIGWNVGTPYGTIDQFHTNDRFAIYTWGGGMLYRTQTGTPPPTLYPGFDMDISGTAGTATIYAQALWDSVDWYPGAGDMFQLINQFYADNAGTTYIRAAKVMRAQAHGIVLDRNNNPLGGITVDFREQSTQQSRGLGTTFLPEGYYQTSDPHGRAGIVHEIIPQVNGAGTVTATVYSRKRTRASFRIPREGNWISYDVSTWGRHVRAYVHGGTIFIGFANEPTGSSWSDKSTGIVGDHPVIKYNDPDTYQHLWLLYSRGGTIVRQYTLDEGNTWNVAGTVTTSGDFPAVVNSVHGLQYVYWVAGSAIKGIIYDALGSIVQPEYTVVSSGVDNTAIDADEYILTGGVWYLNLLYRSGSAIITIKSRDGINFS